MSQSFQKQRNLDEKSKPEIEPGSDEFISPDVLAFLTQYDQPTENRTRDDQLHELRENVENSRKEMERLTEERNTATAEAHELRQRYNRLEEKMNRDRTKISELVEANKQQLTATEEKFRKKVEILETDLEFKGLEIALLRLRQQSKRRHPVVEPVQTVIPAYKTDSETCRGEIKWSSLVAHLISPSDGVFAFFGDGIFDSCAESAESDDPVNKPDSNQRYFNRLKQSIRNSYASKVSIFDLVPRVQPDETEDELVLSSTNLELAVIRNFLNFTVSGNSENISQALNELLEILARELQTCVDQVHKCRKLKALHSYRAFRQFEQHELLLLNCLWKVISMCRKLPGQILVNTLSDILSKLIKFQIYYCRDFLRNEISTIILRVLSIMITVDVPAGPVHDLLDSGEITSFLEIVGVGVDCRIASLGFLEAYVSRARSLNWLCNPSKSICYVTKIAELFVFGEQVASMEIIDLLTAILEHSEGPGWLFPAVQSECCSCRSDLLNRVVLGVCGEARLNFDEYRVRVLSREIQLLQRFSQVDLDFRDRKKDVEMCFIALIGGMKSVYENDGRTMTLAETSRLDDLYALRIDTSDGFSFAKKEEKNIIRLQLSNYK